MARIGEARPGRRPYARPRALPAACPISSSRRGASSTPSSPAGMAAGCRARRDLLAVPPLHPRRDRRLVDWRALGPRRTSLRPRPRVGGRAHRLVVGQFLSFDALQVRGCTWSPSSRALYVLVLALAELLSRSGERIASPGLSDPFTAAQRRRAACLPSGPRRVRCRTGPNLPASAASPTSSSPPTSSIRSRRRWPGSTSCRGTACAPT